MCITLAKAITGILNQQDAPIRLRKATYDYREISNDDDEKNFSPDTEWFKNIPVDDLVEHLILWGQLRSISVSYNEHDHLCVSLAYDTMYASRIDGNYVTEKSAKIRFCESRILVDTYAYINYLD